MQRWRMHYFSVRQWSGRPGSIPGWVIPKTKKMVPDAALLSTQYHKVTIKTKEEQSRERSCALHLLHLGVAATEKEPSGHPRQRLPTVLTRSIFNAMTLVLFRAITSIESRLTPAVVAFEHQFNIYPIFMEHLV